MIFRRIRAAIIIDLAGRRERQEAGRVYGRLKRDLGDVASVTFRRRETLIEIHLVFNSVKNAVRLRPEVERLAEVHR